MGPLISVIVPVYNTENYFIRCLESLRQQSLKQIEVILINDASTDSCGVICENYAEKDECFKVIHHKENKGLSEARNTGIRMATGDYLMFVDSDDVVHKDFCKDAYECAAHYQADLVLFKYHLVKDNDFHFITDSSKDNIYDTATTSSHYLTITEALDLLQQGIGHMAWNKLYKKELFNDILTH